MSDDIQTRSFDGEPAWHRWSNPRPVFTVDAPPDPIEDHRLVCCPCKAERVYGQSCWQCGNPPRRTEK